MTQAPTPPDPWPASAYQAHRPRSGLPGWAKALIIVGIAVTGVVVLVCAGLIYLGSATPQTRALAGSQLTQRDLRTIDDLVGLEAGERIKYFYSDGFLSFEQGMYFFTDRRIVIYGKDLQPPLTTVTYDQVTDITSELSDSWLTDGTIWVELADDSFVAFPISSEGGADRYFLTSLKETWQSHQEAASPD